LSDDQIDLAQALADAFAVAYARYEDFQRLEIAKAEVEVALQHLKATQAQLVQSEKLASLGQLTAGIAHEIKNPLNFINNFAELVGELTEELEEEIESTQDTNGTDNTDQFKEILSDLKMNAKIIAQHGRRADGIVSAMVQHASGGTGKREPTDINELLEEYVNLAYHGKRAQVTGFNCEIIRDYDKAVGAVELVPQEIGRVFINLLGNAFDAVSLQNTDDTVEPKVYVSTEREEDKVRIHVQDNGPGIPAEYIEKIFEPFFTTKPTGSGTGLGLSMSYDIITQGHSGTLSVESKPGGGARFTITLPGSGSGHNNPASTRSESVYAPPHIPRGKTIGKL
jgi:signal transduction histidine kinase